MSKKPIPYGKQQITEEDIQYVVAALKSDYLTQGPKIVEFEEAFAKYIGAEFAIAVSNGTAALHLSTMAMNVAPGQKVITTPITFAASANCIQYCGGEVVFADIDANTYLIDIERIKALLQASPKGTYAGLIPVDFTGRAINLEVLKQLAEEYGLWIIEDACHAPGGYFIDSQGNRQQCGNGNFADLAIFSFHPVKHIATGEGGMITTNNEELYQKLIELRTHGITRDQNKFQNSIDTALGNWVLANSQQPTANSQWPAWYMEMQQLGYNYRLTDFQAALGISQLKRANDGLQKRREIAKRYTQAFADIPQITGQSGVVEGLAYHLYIIEVEDRLGLYNYLREQHIFTQIHYIPVHLMPYYRELGFKIGDYPKAEKYYQHCMSLPMYPTLSLEEQEFVIEKIKSYLTND